MLRFLVKSSQFYYYFCNKSAVMTAYKGIRLLRKQSRSNLVTLLTYLSRVLLTKASVLVVLSAVVEKVVFVRSS